MDEEAAPASSPFAPRASLVRTPPSGLAPPDVARDFSTPPLVPTRPPRLRNTPPTGASPATTAPTAGQKRPLTSPEERRPVDVVRMCRPITPAPSVSLSRPVSPVTAAPISRPVTPASSAPLPCPDASEQESDSDEDMSPSLAKATKLQLLDRVHGDLECIMSAVTGSTSRLNKVSTNIIGARVQDTLAVVAALSLRLCEMEAELGRAKVRCAELEKEALLSHSRLEARPHAHHTPQTYSTALKLPKKADPVQIPAQTGPVLAFYPAQDQTDKLKTAEDTKAELKRAVNPREIDLQVDKLRKVGNAGVLVQTTSPLAASRLRSAAPASLRVSEPRKLAPRISLRDVDGNPSVEDVTLALHDQNLRGTE